ncbi:hypothetical protein NAV11_13905 [Pseudomonas songnenensis]|uniref:Sulfotransferase family protein n=1 Tax=Pseudomonas songnenensis TaxID=1176259 RepID=A0ABX9V165_9PSED|nr:hypothetical protein [Pseudomonas songnenensis]MCQ4301008.1 hypothetical protein [Pseudomonas songnenensis]RMH99479.1 hypothetical protein EA798_02040 [Pseudomonas songnenensis]
MRIALAYFGLPRNSSVCFPSIEKNIYRRLPSGAQVESFYHFYEPLLINNPRSRELGVLGEENYRAFNDMLGILEVTGECLERWDFERIKSYGDVWGDEFKSLSNLVHQLNSLHAVTSRVDDYEPDVVIFLRPDLLYHDALPDFVLPAVLARPNAIYIPHWQWWNGLNDRFAICGRAVYGAYGRRIEQVLPFCKVLGRGLHSERLLRFAMTQAGAKIRTLEMRASRVRVGGEIVEESFSSKRSMGRRENRLALPLARMRACIDHFHYGWSSALRRSMHE